MKHWLSRALVVSLCALVCAVAMSLWPSGSEVRPANHDRNGRPDVWREYDRQGRLVRMAVDTNFDGRLDVREYYADGALIRRESDRDFNNRVDLVEEFDTTTREAVRSLTDVDFDGAADLLVLFQGGQPVYLKWASSLAPAAASGPSAQLIPASQRAPDDQLVPLEDPFRADLALRSVYVVVDSHDAVGLSTSGGLPAPGAAIANPLTFSSDTAGSSCVDAASATVDQYSPRGPPSAHLLS